MRLTQPREKESYRRCRRMRNNIDTGGKCKRFHQIPTAQHMLKHRTIKT